MVERYTRVERNAELYRDNEDHNFRIYFYYILLPITIILILFACINVKATSSLNITNGTTPGTDCSTHPTGKLCYKFRESYPAGNGELYSIGSEEIGVNVYKINFYLNTSVEGYTNNTIKIIGKNFRNIGYLCTSSYFSCRVTYVSSQQLNVHFSNNTSNVRTQTEFALYTDTGAIFNSNDTFKITSLTYLWNSQDTSGGGSSGGGSSGGGSSGSGSTFDDSGIINNQNQNTQDIIDNANSNFQDLQEDLNGLFGNVCGNLFPMKSPRDNTFQSVTYTDNQITATATGTWKMLQYKLAVEPNTQYTFYWESSGGTGNAVAYYSFDGATWNTLANFRNTSFITSGDSLYIRLQNSTITGNSGTYYFRNLTLVKGSEMIAYCVYGTKTSKIDEQTWWQKEIHDTQKETNDLIKDDSINQDQANSFFSDFNDTDNGGISSIISKPLTIINNLLNNNSSCSNLNLPSFMGVDNAYLPSGCILWNNAPSIVVTLWNTLVIGVGSYFILKSLFNDIQKLKDPDNDKVEVMDL